MIVTESDSTPRLPEDLERLIFERAAYEWRPKYSFKLLLIAKRVNDWIRPFIYRIFIQVTSPKFPDFKACPSLRMSDVGKYAKHLLASSDFKHLDLGLLLSSCPNLQNLALWGGVWLPVYVHSMRDLRLTRLSASLARLLPQALLGPTFLNLTHLHITDFGSQPQWNKWAVLEKLHKLSHFAISTHLNDIDIIRCCLVHCLGLKLLIVLLDDYSYNSFGSSTEGHKNIDDEYIVLMLYTMSEMREDWENGAGGGLDFWMTAELFALARKNTFLNNPARRWIGMSLDWDQELNDEGKEWFTTHHLPNW